MEFATEKIGDITVVNLPTDVLDASNTEEFKTAIAPVIEKNKKILFEMSKVKFIDSSGCGVLLSCLRQLNGLGGTLKLCGVQESIRTLFDLVRMHRIIEVFDTKKEAVKSF
ncbi:MAG: anti-anti-sigma factor [Desulfobacterales bacterium S5133MH16]|nr:MAG: anti-anti-sigma factor [Desulfobacterales bacterium S5133MH16]